MIKISLSILLKNIFFFLPKRKNWFNNYYNEILITNYLLTMEEISSRDAYLQKFFF